jgi:hypothetical protein
VNRFEEVIFHPDQMIPKVKYNAFLFQWGKNYTLAVKTCCTKQMALIPGQRLKRQLAD